MKIFEPVQIKGMKLKNRIAMAPFANMPRAEDGSVNEVTIRWYEERAKGGVGLIVAAPLSVSTIDMSIPFQRTIRKVGTPFYDERQLVGYEKLAEVMHSYDVKIGPQIVGGGPMMGGQGPSPTPYPDEKYPKDGIFDVLLTRMPTRELSVEEIEQHVHDFGVVAAKMKAAGMDFVEIHACHGGASMLSSFMSPFYNRRTDKYGGDWEGRLRLPIEVIKEVRRVVGKDYPILIRISADQILGKRGVTIEDTTQIIVPALEKAGVDCIDASMGSYMHSTEGIIVPMYYPRGYFIYCSAAVKQVTKLPVIGVGRIVDMEMANRFIEEGKADIIHMGRQLAADPETPKKYFEGRPEDIRKCIGCVYQSPAFEICGRPCAINYDIQDNPIPLTPAEKPKKVLVIGGGVAGMEAARITTMRGHKVTLMQKDSELGGVVAALALTKLTGEFGNIVDYLAAQMRKLKVDVRVCKEATLADVEELKPDVVILAAGSSDIMPEVARGKAGVMNHSEACRRQREIGQKVVIWGFFGAELAISLAEEGKDVVLIGKGAEGSLASDAPWMRRYWLLRRLTDVNVVRETPQTTRLSNPEVLYNIEVDDITPQGIAINAKDGGKRVLPYDTLILSRRFGERSTNDSLFGELQGKVAEIYKIGDCLQVRDIKEAIWGANEVARKI